MTETTTTSSVTEHDSSKSTEEEIKLLAEDIQQLRDLMRALMLLTNEHERRLQRLEALNAGTIRP